MKINSRQNGVTSNLFNNGSKARIVLPKKTKKPLYGGFDDFLDRLVSLKERGDLIISGKRIC